MADMGMPRVHSFRQQVDITSVLFRM